MLIALRSAKCFGLAIGQQSDRNERSLLSLVIVFPNFLQRNCLFREEIDTDIVWAGRFDPDERQQRVRTSFEAWRELKLLVELMGGEIWLHSVGYGQGTTVSFPLGRSP